MGIPKGPDRCRGNSYIFRGTFFFFSHADAGGWLCNRSSVWAIERREEGTDILFVLMGGVGAFFSFGSAYLIEAPCDWGARCSMTLL